MKGTVFQGNLQFHVDIQGEAWTPGQMLRGQLNVNNQGSAPINLAQVGITLAHGLYKKVKASDPKAFTAFTTQTFGSDAELPPGQANQLTWSIPLEETAPITDKAGSLFLVFGNLADKTKGGHLLITVGPGFIIQEYLKIFENFFRFKAKELRQSKDMIQIKMTPPTSKEFSSTEGLLLFIKNQAGKLDLKYEFTIKKLGYTQGSVAMEKKELIFSYSLAQKDFMLGKDMIDQDKMLAHFNEVLNQVKMKANY
ncbi:MAG: sporulation protein [Bdellovibrio sp.]|nr:sporulation protein [Bdellovibrio sp.]